MDQYLCQHGEYEGDCPDCRGECPHGVFVRDCEECNWQPGNPSSLGDSYVDFEYRDADAAERRLVEYLDQADSEEIETRKRPLWDLYGPDEAEQRERRQRQERLIGTLETALRSHGRPLHWEVLLRMARDANLGFHISPQAIYLALSRRKDLFDAVATGVYGLKRR
jgi:hypothetical protein